jgi:hypothetical protein
VVRGRDQHPDIVSQNLANEAATRSQYNLSQIVLGARKNSYFTNVRSREGIGLN